MTEKILSSNEKQFLEEHKALFMKNDLDTFYKEAFKAFREMTSIIPTHFTKFFISIGINPFDYIKESIIPKIAVYIEDLTELNLSSPNIKEIGFNAFTLCINLKSVKLNEGLKEIGSAAFMDCRSLKFIELPSTLEIIHQDAFADSGLEMLTIPKNVKQLKEGALKNLPSIKEITFEGIPENMWSYVISDPAPRNPKLIINIPWTREYEKEMIAKKQWKKDWCFNRRFYKMNYRG